MVHWPLLILAAAFFLLKTELDFSVVSPGDMRADVIPF